MQARIKKLQKFIFILLLILLPTQLGMHFWPEWAFVNGIRVDYFSPTIYVTDLLILLLFVLEVPRIKLGNLGGLGLLGIFALVNIYFSLSPAVSIYKWLKVAEMGFLAWFVAKNVKLTNHNVKFLLIPVFYEAVLAIWQFLNQGSIGGLWYWLGERTFNGGTPGIAKAVISGELVLRPYGTFSHPNVLAGFLIVTILTVLKFSLHISRKINAVVLILIIFVVFLTLSRGNLVSGLNLRQRLNIIAVTQWTKFPIVGTGLGTSPLYPRKIQNYALVHQPIHNIYLLVLAETGLFGVWGGLGVLGMIIKNKKLLGPPLAILFLGLFDHYFLTLQQGQLVLSLTVGLALGTMKRE